MAEHGSQLTEAQIAHLEAAGELYVGDTTLMSAAQLQDFLVRRALEQICDGRIGFDSPAYEYRLQFL